MHWIVEESILGSKGLKTTSLENLTGFYKNVIQYTLASVFLCFAEAGQSR